MDLELKFSTACASSAQWLTVQSLKYNWPEFNSSPYSFFDVQFWATQLSLIFILSDIDVIIPPIHRVAKGIEVDHPFKPLSLNLVYSRFSGNLPHFLFLSAFLLVPHLLACPSLWHSVHCLPYLSEQSKVRDPVLGIFWCLPSCAPLPCVIYCQLTIGSHTFLGTEKKKIHRAASSFFKPLPGILRMAENTAK